MCFASVRCDFIQKVTLIRGYTLGGHSGTGGVHQPFHGFVRILFFAAVHGGTGESITLKPVTVQRGIGFFFCFICNGLLADATCGFLSLHGNGRQHLFILFPGVVEQDFTSYGIRDFAEVDTVGVGIGDFVVVGILLHHNNAVFIEIGAHPGLVPEQVTAGNAIHRLVPVF